MTFLGWLNAAFKGLSDLQTKGLKGRFESPGMYITIYVYTKIIQVVFVVFLSLYLGWDLQVAPQFFFGVLNLVPVLNSWGRHGPHGIYSQAVGLC